MQVRVATFVAALFATLISGSALHAQGIEIRWEITNRFAPFEALGDAVTADQLFDQYRVRPQDGGLEGWHARLDRTIVGGMTSPYAPWLERGDRLHWDPSRAQHTDALLKYVRDEDAQTVRVKLGVAADDPSKLAGKECWWSFRNGPTPCDLPVAVQIPLTGSTEVAVIVGDEVVKASMEPEHVVIVGMGDSYGSGEGNPDVPAQWKGITLGSHEWLSSASFRQPLPARKWVDDRCHRSFFSFQSLAALEVASKDPHRFVTFLHYACSGAEVFDGLLAPQNSGFPDAPFVPLSQVNAAVRELCRTGVERRSDLPRGQYADITATELGGIDITAFERRPYPAAENRFPTELVKNDALDRYMRQFRGENGTDEPSVGMMSCPEGSLRKPDLLMLSIGGNDIGFADLVKYALLPGEYDSSLIAFFTLPSVCPPAEYRADPGLFPTVAQHCLRHDMNDRPHAADLIYGRNGGGGIGERLTLLYNVLQYRLELSPEDIVQTQYPDPLRVVPTREDACGPIDVDRAVVFGTPAGEDPASAWEGLKIGAPLNIARNWSFDFTPEEGYRTLAVFDMLRVELAKAAKRNGISVVCETRDAFVGHGWWQGLHTNLPNAGPPEKQWDADLWAPYAYDPGDRAIRTGNDSAMTQPDPHSAITGAVHPNLTGHRMLAERLAARVDAELRERKAFNADRIGNFLEGIGDAIRQ
ncbi:hypothetical protein [Maritimibacter dapengensis]|uniref:GDSL-like Lipase/Acylhydrolase family protein n=1 Tax=Maritimibacter dapengensis TaxID=2836868 RepID=A0ABS6T759_9RHOB|nr:hypothetical protein [Maritimibacter dapengensis]MBV7380336.1 hypothetical protein [Maritimibacter dapengensis]